MTLFFRSLKTALTQVWPVLKQRWPLLLILHVLSFSSGQLLDHWQEQTLAAGTEDWLTLIPLFLTSGLAEIVLSTAWLVAVIACTPGFGALVQSLNAALIESTRALASVVRWAPALVVPGLVKYLRYMLVPFVVVTDERYERGAVDALGESHSLSRGHLGLLFAALLFDILFSLALGQLIHGGNDSVFVNAGPALFWGALTLFINLFMALFLFSIYQNLVTVRQEKASC